MAATKPTLTYFSIPGRAEVARLILEDAGVDYVYVAPSDWDQLKQELAGKLAFGQIPMYEDSVVTLVQSGTINRFLSRKHGYGGEGEVEQTLIDMVYEGANDVLGLFLSYNYKTEEAAQPAALDNLLRKEVPAQLGYFEVLLEKNGNNGFLVGSKLSYADLALYNGLNALVKLGPTAAVLLEGFPRVKAHHHSVGQRDRIKAYSARAVYE